MKTLFMLALISAPAFAAEPVAPPAPLPPAQGPVERCKAEAAFKYEFDMMKIEGEEIRTSITHREADEKKSKRHGEFKEQMEDCDDLKS